MKRSYGGCTLSLCVVEEDNPEANPISCDDCPYYDPYLYKEEVKGDEKNQMRIPLNPKISATNL